MEQTRQDRVDFHETKDSTAAFSPAKTKYLTTNLPGTGPAGIRQVAEVLKLYHAGGEALRWSPRSCCASSVLDEIGNFSEDDSTHSRIFCMPSPVSNASRHGPQSSYVIGLLSYIMAIRFKTI